MKYIGDANINGGFSPKSPKPLDDRLVVENPSDRFKISKDIAYVGMPVIDATTGYIYVLQDTNNIDSGAGWIASHETVQIQIKTAEEFLKLKDNTTDKYTRKDPEQECLHPEIYYYITEPDSKDNLFYVTRKELEDLDSKINNKATKELLSAVSLRVTSVEDDYIKNADLNVENEDSTLSKSLKTYNDNTLANLYATKNQINDLSEVYVTKDYLNSFSDEVIESKVLDDFDKVNEDIESINILLSSKLSSEDLKNVHELSLTKIETSETLNINAPSVLVNSKELALKENIPNIKVLTELEYANSINLDGNTYYMTYGEDDSQNPGYISLYQVKAYFKSLTDTLISKNVIVKEDINGSLKTLLGI